MGRKKGFMAGSLLLLLSAVCAALGGFLFYMARSRGGSLTYGNGLHAVYAAESGANWALKYLAKGELENKKVTIPLAEQEARVTISFEEKEGAFWKGKIISDGVDLKTKMMRFVKIRFVIEEGAERKIVVESVESDR